MSRPPAMHMANVDVRCRRAWGLIERKPRWSLSWPGRLLALLLVAALGIGVCFYIHRFLAITDRVDANVLVVEGWMHDYALRAAVAEFRRGSYQRVFTTGGPVEGSGGYINDYQTNASIGAETLKKFGIPEQYLQMVPSQVMDRDRTYASAVALRDWFYQHDMSVSSINVLTENVHARRSQLLFSKALGPKISVGVIAVANPDYDAQRWWNSSEAVKDVLTESLGYLYARFLFRPSKHLNAHAKRLQAVSNST